MDKFDKIDIIFISLISFYLLVFTIIFILLLWKHHGIKGLFRYLLDRNAITITNSGEVIDHTESSNKKKSKKNKELSTKNKITIKEFFEKRVKSLKKDIAKELISEQEAKKNEDKLKANTKASAESKTKNTTSKAKSSTSRKKSTTKKNTTAAKKKTTTPVKKKPTSNSKKATNKKTTSNTTKKKATNTAKKKTSKK